MPKSLYGFLFPALLIRLIVKGEMWQALFGFILNEKLAEMLPRKVPEFGFFCFRV